MQNITSISELKNAIQLLEVDQAIKGQLLKEQFYITYESLKPINLLKNALSEVSTSPYLIDNILGTTMGLVSGYLSKKIFIGSSGNIIRKLIGSVLQFGITNVVAKHSDAIKAFGQAIIQYILHRKEINSRRGD
ncbi:MAG: hypothetical protein NTV31_06240 [Bacteroidia bacterium]|nr:hypothetical protein [Bacteroidia bacterium]